MTGLSLNVNKFPPDRYATQKVVLSNVDIVFCAGKSFARLTCAEANPLPKAAAIKHAINFLFLKSELYLFTILR